MRKALWAGAAAALACAGSVGAHHSGYAYATTPVWIQGSVVRFERINPHTIIMLEDRSAPGQVRVWAVEGPAEAALDRRDTGMSLPKLGDTVAFCAFPYKPPAELSKLWPGLDVSKPPWSTDASGRQFVAGHVMVLPDGKMQLWEPHGIISECVRSSKDRRQTWIDFLDSTPKAREAWCEQRVYAHVRSTASLRELVEDIDGSIDEPCE